MKTTRIMAAAVLAFGIGMPLSLAHAQQQAVQRTDVLHNDLGVAGREFSQVRVDFEPGAVSIKHSHPGVEVAYVLEGTMEYQLEGRPPVTLKAGEALFIPDGVAHVAKNVSSGKTSELATYIVRKGEPVVVSEK